jgi:hypothetical protein
MFPNIKNGQKKKNQFESIRNQARGGHGNPQNFTLKFAVKAHIF